MARWSATTLATWTPVAVADPTSFTAAGYAALQGHPTPGSPILVPVTLITRDNVASYGGWSKR